jgi:hypothetical protein
LLAHQPRNGVGPTIRPESIQTLQAAGVTTLQGIAAELNKLGIPTASGRGEWKAA